jgi:hypothetical protein
MGTLTQKIQCQLRAWVMPPPINGPEATASPAMPPQIPTTAPRFSDGNADVRIVRLRGITMAAPIPWIARKAIRMLASGASAQAAEATVKRAKPTTYIRRRPSRSPRAAAVNMPAPNAMV